MSKKEPASLNRNTDKYVFALLLQQSVELLINLSAVPGPLRAWQDPCKGAEEDTGSHSSKDVHRGMCFPLRSYQVPLTLLPSNVDVLQPEQDTILFIPSSPQRAEAPMEILSVCQCSYLCLWWVLILRWATDHWVNVLPYHWWAITAHQFGQPRVLTEPCCTVQ